MPLPIPYTGASVELTPPTGLWPSALGLTLGTLAVAVAVYFMVWLYRHETRVVRRRVAVALLVLRSAAVLIVLLTLTFDPVFMRTTTEPVPGRVLVAFDTSDSMRVTDPHRPIGEKLRLITAIRLASDLYSESELNALIGRTERSGEVDLPPVDTPAGRRARERLDEAVKRHDDMTRLAVAVRAIGPDGADLLSTWGERHVVEVASFDQVFAGLPSDTEGLVRTLALDGPSPGGTTKPAYTDLKLPLTHASQSTGVAADPTSARLLGVVVLTDGRHNWGDSPLQLADQLGKRKVPVYPVLVAPELPPPDVAVVAARPQSATVFKGSFVPVEVEVRVAGWPAGQVRVTLRASQDAAEPEAETAETIDHAGMDTVYRLTLRAKLDAAGPWSLKVTAVSEDHEDRFPENNTRTARVNVVKDRARVLLIDGDARWEFHYLHTCLGRDENMDVRSVVFRQPRVTRATDEEVRPLGLPAREMPVDPDALSTVDCLVIGDVEPSQFSAAERERVERYVADAGGTLVFVAGKRAMPLSYMRDDDPFRRLLPVRKPSVLDEPQGFRPMLTPEADRTWFLQMADSAGESRQAWGRLPPHFWAVVGEAKDGAEALASAPGKPPREAALIARQNYGFGRVLYVGIDSTWRWRYKVGDYYHHRFWGQVAQWAASDRLLPTVNAAGTIRFGTREPVFRPGQVVEVVVRSTEAVRTPAPQSLKGARVIRLSDGPDGKESPAGLVPLTATEGRPRELTATFRDLDPGRYAVELDVPEWADQLRGPPGPDGRSAPLRARFEVLPPDGDEMVELSGNRELLEQIAAASGGQVYTPETLGELAETLTAKVATREEQVRRAARQSWWTLGLFVLLLTTEWVVRKWNGLP
jgi:hypothetical protein